MLFRRPVSDKALVERVLRGQRDEFGRLVERYLPMVHALAFAQVGNATDADDVAQDAFLKAYTSLDTLHNRAAFRPWLAAIARNAAKSVIRARKSTTPVDPNTPASGDVQRDAERRELHEVLRRELLRLDPEFREVLLLHYFSGLKIREVAETIGASPDATAKRIQRARDALGTSLVRELGHVQGEQGADWRNSRTRIMAAIAAAPVAWEAKALAGVGGIGVVTVKLLASIASLALLVGAAIIVLLSSKSGTPHPSDAMGVAQAATGVASTREAASATTARSAMVAHLEAVTYPVLPQGGHVIIRGRVLYPDGRPAAGARVVLAERHGETVPTASSMRLARRLETVSDDHGDFEFSNLDVGMPAEFVFGLLVATVPGHVGVGGAILVGASSVQSTGGHFVWLELQPCGEVAGRVVDPGGLPVAGAIVVPARWSGGAITGFQDLGILINVETDANGEFSFPFLWPGAWEFVVSAPGFARRMSQPIEVGTTDATVPLSDACLLSGVVVDAASGEPVSGVTVVARDDGEMLRRGAAVTDAKGRYTLSSLEAGTYEIDVKGTHYLADGTVMTALKDSMRPRDVNLRVRRGAVIEGSVLHAVSLEPAPNVPVRLSKDSIGLSTTTDLNGYFQFDGVAPGRCEVAVDLSGYPTKTVTIAGTENEHCRADFQLDEGRATVAGIAVDESGEPVPGARLELEERGKRSTTDQGGRFEFTGLRPGATERITAITDDGVTLLGWFELSRSDRTEVRVTLERPAWLIGRVVDSAGRPVVGLQVDSMRSVAPAYSRPFATTVSGGRFALAHMAPGEYQLRTEPEGRPGADLGSVVLKPGETVADVEFVIPESSDLGSISGTVTSAKGKGIAGAHVHTQGPGGISARVWGDGRGHYSFEGLPPGVYRVVASIWGYTQEESIVVPSEDRVDFTFHEAGTIHGRVMDAATGAPVPEFRISYASIEVAGVETFRRRTSVISSADGTFALEDLRPGPAEVSVAAVGYATASIAVDLPTGGQLTGVVLRPTRINERQVPEMPTEVVSLNGVVVDGRGSPIANASIFIEHVGEAVSESNARAAVTAVNGSFAMTAVPVTATRVIATHPDFATTSFSTTPPSAVPRHVELVMAPPASIHGVVMFGDEPLAQAWVAVRFSPDERGVYQPVNTDIDGRYILSNLPPGDAILSVTRHLGGRHSRKYEQPVTVTTGASVESTFALVGGDAVVEGVVTSAGMSAAATVHVGIPLADGTVEDSFVTVDMDGSFIIPMLPELLITLRVTSEDGRDKEIQVTPTASETTYVEIDLAE